MTSVLDSLKRLEYEGYHFEVADGSLELLLRNSTGWRQPFFELESYRVIADQGDELSTEATVKVRVGGRADRRHGRGQRPGQRPGRCPAGRHRQPLPGARRGPPGRLPGAGPRLGQGHRLGHPGPHRLDRRRPDLDHHRGVGEHHRRLLAGPVRLGRLRSAPHRGPTPELDTGHAAWHRLPCDRPDPRPPARQEHPRDPAQFRPRRRGGPGPPRLPAARPVDLDAPRGRPSCGAPGRRRAPSSGTPGPDQGFALKLARRFEDRLVLAPGRARRGRHRRAAPRWPCAGRPASGGRRSSTT